MVRLHGEVFVVVETLLDHLFVLLLIIILNENDPITVFSGKTSF